RARMVRLILECGNIEADAAIIDRPDFADQLADGVVAGLNEVFGAAPEPDPEPTFPPFRTVGTLREPRMVMVSVDALNARQWGELDQPVRAVWRRGRRF